MSEGPERVILLARGLDQHDNERSGVVGKPDRGVHALAGAPVHDGHPRIFCVKRDACVEVARSSARHGPHHLWLSARGKPAARGTEGDGWTIPTLG